MHLTEVAPLRWTVRERKPKVGEFLPLLGTVEYHEFYTYTPGGARVKSGFWTARHPSNGWKSSDEYGGWMRAKTKAEAIEFLNKKRKNSIKS